MDMEKIYEWMSISINFLIIINKIKAKKDFELKKKKSKNYNKTTKYLHSIEQFRKRKKPTGPS